MFLDPQMIVSLITFGGTALLWLIILRVKNERLEQVQTIRDKFDAQRVSFSAELESLRKENAGAFASAPVVSERDKSAMHRLENMEREIIAIRAQMQDLAKALQVLDRLVTQMEDISETLKKLQSDAK